MDNCTYNKIKVLRELSLVSAFVGKYCRKDAHACKHKVCDAVMHDIHTDLEMYMEKLRKAL